MRERSQYPSDVAFTPAVKAQQARLGSRTAYARMEEAGSWETRVTPELAAFLARQRSFFLATASREGQPYVQHRGGPPGFVKVLDAGRLAFADFAGNRQYVSMGNLAENPRAQLFFIDYGTRERIKVWGRARMVEDDPALLAQLAMPGYRARVERAFVLDVQAWDANCPQHIPLRLEAAEVEAELAIRDLRIAELEARLLELGQGADLSSRADRKRRDS